jgi:hypothetical protein
MLHYIENLRKKPEHVRRKAVFAISVSISSFILIIWLVTLFIRIKHTDFSLKDTNNDSNNPSLKETFSNFFGGVKNIINTGTPDYVSTTTGGSTNTNGTVFK